MPNHCPRRIEPEDLRALLTEASPAILHPPPAQDAGERRRGRPAMLVGTVVLGLALGFAGTWGTLASAGRLTTPLERQSHASAIQTAKQDVQVCREENAELERNLRIAAENHANDLEAAMADVLLIGEEALLDAEAWTEQGKYSECIANLRAFDAFIEDGAERDALTQAFVKALRAGLPELADDDLRVLEIERLIAELVEITVE